MTNNPNAVGGFQDNPQNINRKGRPKGTGRPTFEKILKSIPEKSTSYQDPITGKELDPYQGAVMQLISAAYNGESWAIKDLLDRGLGKAMQALEVTADVTENNPYAELSTDDLRRILTALKESDTE